MLTAWLPVIIGAIIVIFVLVLLISGYVKASPDKAFIISGLRKTPKILIGKAGVKVPFLERKDELSLQLIPIDVKTASSVPTADYININVDAAVNIKISDKPDKLKLAAQNFLNKRPDYIAQVAREVLEGNMREIVGKMKLEEMVSDRQKFANLVKENADPDLGEMGLDIISFNVQNFVDDSGVIENLGVDNIVKIQKSAAIARAESEKEIAVAQAIAGKEANDAKVAAETAIAERNNELEIKKAELKIISDSKKADADAAYKIQEQERRKTIEATTGDADVSFAAGVPFEQGREKDGLCQPGTVSLRLTGADTKALLENGDRLLEIGRIFKEDYRAGKTGLPCKRQDLPFGRLTAAGQISYVNYSCVYGLDPTDIRDLSRGEMECRQYVMDIYRYLKANFEELKNTEVASIAPEIGFRDSRRIDGMYHLTIEDMESRRHFDDVIAVFPRFYDMLAPDANMDGDGKVEIRLGKEAGARCIGLASNEADRCGIDAVIFFYGNDSRW